MDSKHHLFRLILVVVNGHQVAPVDPQVGGTEGGAKEGEGEEHRHLVEEGVFEDGPQIGDGLVVDAQFSWGQRLPQVLKSRPQRDLASAFVPFLKNQSAIFFTTFLFNPQSDYSEI